MGKLRKINQNLKVATVRDLEWIFSEPIKFLAHNFVLSFSSYERISFVTQITSVEV